MAASKPIEVAVVGAGPAGCVLAHRLAAGGAGVTLFDPSHPREKVCAGGIGARAREMFPELEQLVPLGRQGTGLRLVGPSGGTLQVTGEGKTFAIDRLILDRFLLDRAIAAGAEWHALKVTDIRRSTDGFTLVAGGRSWPARVLVGADGVFSLVRKTFLGHIPKRHRAFGAHVLVDRLDPPSALLKFFGDRRGYAWVFNRRDRSSVGVGLPRFRMSDWREILARFFAEQAPGRPLSRVRAWSLPQASGRDFFKLPTGGDDWLLIGDAAGHVDPLTGEGIWYAMWDGCLAAESILAGRPSYYENGWRDAYLERFEMHLRFASLLERGRLLDLLFALGRFPAVGSRLFSLIGGK